MPLRPPALVLFAAAIACVPAEVPPGRTAVPPPPFAVHERDALLVAALPVESDGVTVVYDVTGPAGITGELEAHARSGGWRRETWSLVIPSKGGAPVDVAGERVITPDLVYHADAQGRRLARSSLGPLADAWAAAPAATRAAVLAHVQRWTAELTRARHEQPGRTREIAGTTCSVLAVGSAEVCVWEATGLPLAYRGAAFELRARRIDRGVEHDAATFAVPDDVSASPAAAAAPPAVRLERLAQGDVRELAALTMPPGPLAPP